MEALMKSTIVRIILVAAAALTAACNSTDSFAPRIRPAAARLDVANGDASMKQPVDRYVFVSCLLGGTGETVRVTGDLRYDVHSTLDGTGVSHLNIKSNTSNLTAIGETSGTFFRGTMAERINSRAEDYLNSDVRIADVIHFAATGSGDSYSLMVKSHFIVDQGSYVLWEQSWSEVCN
jgi:hypothetical protein